MGVDSVSSTDVNFVADNFGWAVVIGSIALAFTLRFVSTKGDIIKNLIFGKGNKINQTIKKNTPSKDKNT